MKHILLLLIGCLLLTQCRKEDEIIRSTETVVDNTEPGNSSPQASHEKVKGFFLLNEGNMGNNKCTLDFFDITTGKYHKNIYAERNPGVVKELGDVGNDIQIYGNKIYAVINCSHFVEVMDMHTARHITQISIPNCRYIVFDKGYAYVSSYAGPVKIDPNARLGYVAKVDTATLQVVDTCVVGYQPEEMVIRNNKLYVANSGGYRVPNYDRTVSVIDLNNFKKTEDMDVAINLHRMEADRHGYIYVSSRGDYYHVPSKTFVIDTRTNKVVKEIPLSNSNMTLSGDSLYIYGTEWSYLTNDWSITYAILDTNTQEVVSKNFITDGTEKKITMPYGIAINPDTKDIYVTDAKNYVTPGLLYCFDAKGKFKWKVITGDIPAHFAFTYQPLQPKNN